VFVCSRPKDASQRKDGRYSSSSTAVWTTPHALLISVSHAANTTLGGWTLGNIDTENAFCANLCTGEHAVLIPIRSYTTFSGVDCVVVSVDYRLAPENPYPEAVEDAIEALQWVWESGAFILGINPKRIAVGGTSRHVAL